MSSPTPAFEPVRITVVDSEACHFCEDAHRALTALAANYPLAVDTVAVRSEAGQALMARHRAPMSPLVLLEGTFFSSGRLPRRKLEKLLKCRYGDAPSTAAAARGPTMGDLLTTGSVLAAFFAGGIALFAPCCIVFLAPSYLAVAVKNRRWRLLPLTFVFAAGLALVLVPITLGISLVASTIANYHAPLYYAGGALMLALAGLSLSGRMLSLPSFLRAPDTARGDSASFFALGVFSGIASSCCAPVLAGVMTLSALSGSAIGGVTLGLAYTFGMVFPLFVMALLWDRFRLGERGFLRAKPVRLRLAGKVLATNSINIAIAAAFTVMGGFVIYLANTGQMTGGPGFQVSIGKGLSEIFARIETWVDPVPEPVLGLVVLALAAVFVIATLRDRHRPDGSTGAAADEHLACHAPAADAHPEHHR